MGDVRGNTGSAQQRNGCRNKPSSEFAPDDRIIDFDGAGNRTAISECQLASSYVALHDAIDMDLTFADDVAFDGEITT